MASSRVLISVFTLIFQSEVFAKFSLFNPAIENNTAAAFQNFDLDYVDMIGDNGEIVRGIIKPPPDLDMSKIRMLPSLGNAITYSFYSREVYEGVEFRDFAMLTSVGFSNSKPVKVQIHGWTDNRNATLNLQMRRGFLLREDCNVFVVDWGRIADDLIYPIPMYLTSDVSVFVGQFLNHLIENEGVSASNIHMVGHSLGAHVSGFSARRVRQGRIGRITGLDPANPGFGIPDIVRGGRLRSDDAQFVDIIHTSSGVLGLPQPIGHADFYPNGGTVPQPGCNIRNVLTACSHGRSWEYFSDSLLVTEWVMLGQQCGNYDEYKNGQCGNNPTVPMGYLCPPTTRGVFYLKTGPESPYAVGAPNDLTSNHV